MILMIINKKLSELGKINLLSISFIVPTFNSGKVLDKCLNSIVKQNYPKELIEILIIDGGSIDDTIEIAKKYTKKIYKNPLKTGEAGKAVGVKKAKSDLIALIDSDNILPDENWLKEMVVPFEKLEIIGSEPWKFSYREKDGFIDRYCALMGMNDPLCYSLRNYDRLNILTGKWTGLNVEQEDCGSWINVTIKPKFIPTIGANGTIFRKKILLESGLISDYFFDVDIIARLADKKPVSFAKVKSGIIHLYCGNSIKKFIHKQRRRIRDYLYYKKSWERSYPWLEQSNLGIIKFIISSITLFPLIYQMFKGYYKKTDCAWLFHPLACILTLFIYSFIKFSSFFSVKELSREKWVKY